MTLTAEDRSGKLVSVVMPAYKVGEHIAASLRSVALQDHRDWEVIVVDDHAPDDGTTAIVQEFARKHPARRVELIRHARNQGVSAARNTAIGAALGDFLAFLDPDDIWAPWHLSTMLKPFIEDPALDYCTGPVVNFRNGPPGSYRKEIGLPDWKVQYFPHSLAIHNFIQPSATVARTQVVRAIGGFAEDPSLQHVEDYDLWIRAVCAGQRFGFVRTPTTAYRKHPAAASADAERMRVLDERIRSQHRAFFEAGAAHVVVPRSASDAPSTWSRLLKRWRIVRPIEYPWIP